jgi:hypothetical protein
MGGELLWMLECLPEIESDMSVFHRIESIYTMSAVVFLRRVQHLPAYDGALAARLRREQTQRDPNPAAPVSGQQAVTEDALWAAHRQRAYAKFLSPGESVREVSVREGLALASRAFRTGG